MEQSDNTSLSPCHASPPVALPRAAPGAAQAFETAHPGVESLDAIIPDLCGVFRGKRLPWRDAAKLCAGGMPVPASCYLLDAVGANTDAVGSGFTDGDPDVTAWPVAGGFALVPWRRRATAQILMSTCEGDGRPCRYDPRAVLAQVVGAFDAIGLKPVVAFELEFYLLDRSRDAKGRPRPFIDADGRRPSQVQVLSMADVDRASHFLDDVVAACRVQGIPAGGISAEYAPGQFEINLAHGASPVVAADQAALFRRLVQGVARKHELDASFMAKPFIDRAGNGMHLHLSLVDADNRNIFADKDPFGAPALRHAIGGLQAVAAESMAIFAPNVNSFRRYRENFYTPVNMSWGANNRSVSLRIPSGDASSRRIEHRFAGADANPYLVLAAVLAGVHHGVQAHCDPGAPADGNASVKADPTLPRTWQTALDSMTRGTVLRHYLGADYLRAFGEAKQTELDRFFEYIGDREYRWYLLP